MRNTKKTPREKQDVFWTVLMMVTCLFPFTVPLVIAAAIYEARDTRTDNKRLLFSGLGALTFAFFMILSVAMMSFLGETNDVLPIFLLYYSVDLVLGIVLLIMHGLIKKRNLRLEKCRMLIEREHITSVKDLCEIMGFSEKELDHDLNRLIRSGLLKGASLSPDGSEIVFQRSIWARQHVVCENCGAELVVNLGQTLICEYCGGPLKVRRIREINQKK